MISAIGARTRRPRARGTEGVEAQRPYPGPREGREVYRWAPTYEKIAARGPKHQLSSLKRKPWR